jgi:hypothetical protein
MKKRDMEIINKYLNNQKPVRRTEPLKNWIIIILLGSFIGWLAVMAATS